MREKAWTRSRAALIDVHTNGSGCCCRRKYPRAHPGRGARTASMELAVSWKTIGDDGGSPPVVSAVAVCCGPATPTPLVLVSEGG